MPRKPNTAADHYNDPFPQRLRSLLEGNRTPQHELSEILGVARQQISQYQSGNSTPTLDNLGKIARFFGVSTDYLLGNTDVPSANPDTRAVCEELHLSQKAFENLKSFDNPNHSAIINKLLEADHETILEVIEMLYAATHCLDLINKMAPSDIKEFFDLFVDYNVLPDMYFQRAFGAIKKILLEDENNGSKKDE